MSRSPGAAPPGDQAPRPSESILEVLDGAITEHVAWLQQWHRALLCGTDADRAREAQAPDPCCGFGRWYEENRGDGLVGQPAFQLLAQSHGDMHDQARLLADLARRGRAVTAEAYDLFTVKVIGFTSKVRRLERVFRKASSDLDPLTGVYNRQAMMQVLYGERERYLRTGAPCSLALADIDHFKSINDRFGHQIGDDVLFAVAARFSSLLRPFDMIFRYGGEEFLLCLPGTGADAAAGVLDRLRLELADRPVVLADGTEIPVTASFGIAALESDQPIDAIIERADKALYAAKHRGRNRVQAWSAAAG